MQNESSGHKPSKTAFPAGAHQKSGGVDPSAWLKSWQLTEKLMKKLKGK